MNYIKTQNLGRQQWLALRRGGLGGSDVAAVLGLSPYRTALDVYLEKTGEKQPVTDNPRMQAGRLLEDTVANWWALQHNARIRRDHKIRIHPRHHCLFGNIDRLIVSGNDKRGPGVLEVKTTSGYVYKQWQESGLPPDTHCQIMHYLNVTGHRWGRVAILVDGYDLHDIAVGYDSAFIRQMTEKLLDFWHNNVCKHQPPQPVNENDLKQLWPKADADKIIQADAATLQTIDKLVDVTARLADLSDAKKELELQIKLLLKDATVLAAGNTTLATWKQNRDSAKFDIHKFRTEHPALYENYTETSPGSRRFLLKCERKQNIENN